jgi:hypothetical protein
MFRGGSETDQVVLASSDIENRYATKLEEQGHP